MKKISILRIWTICLAGVFLFFTQSASAEDTIDPELLQRLAAIPGLEIIEIDKRQVVKSSLKNTLQLILDLNTQIKSSVLGQEVAASELLASQKRFNPTWVNKFQHQRSTSASANFSGEGSSPYLLYNVNNANSVSSSWSKKTSNGINYSAVLSASSSKNKGYYTEEEDGSLEDGFEDKDAVFSSSLTLGMSVPIFQGWGDINDIPLYKSELKMKDSKVSTHDTKLQILEAFAQIYWDLAGLWETKRVLQEAVKVSQQLLEEDRIRQDLGVAKLTDVKQSEIQLLKNKQSLSEVENNIRKVEDQVRIALDLRALPYGFLPGDRPQLHEAPVGFESLLEKVLNNSTDLQMLKSQIRINEYDLEKAHDQDDPDLDLNLSYTWSGAEKELFNTFDAYSKFELNGYQVGLTWSVPLYDYETAEQIKQKKLERTQLDIQVSSIKDQLYVELKSIQRSLDFAERDIKQAIAIRELAATLLDQEIEKQSLGQSTSLDVSEAQQELISAQSNEIQSFINYEKVYLSLLVLTGDIFEQYQLPRQN
ncbi:MAG: TolC family protein [SAR324 cluster bacterium]|nr:TolC family protein [SAR324 cluster bacterium]